MSIPMCAPPVQRRPNSDSMMVSRSPGISQQDGQRGRCWNSFDCSGSWLGWVHNCAECRALQGGSYDINGTQCIECPPPR